MLRGCNFMHWSDAARRRPPAQECCKGGNNTELFPPCHNYTPSFSPQADKKHGTVHGMII
eukprot:1157439-Pelagomonas_calceolata.AAC.4